MLLLNKHQTSFSGVSGGCACMHFHYDYSENSLNRSERQYSLSECVGVPAECGGGNSAMLDDGGEVPK